MIIGISGLAGSGKDFIADLLVQDHNFIKIALADPIKRVCKDIFDFSDEQLWGPSEMRNKEDKRYWTGERDDGFLAKEKAKSMLLSNRIAEGRQHLTILEEEIYEECKIYLTPRRALQQLGTQWGRDCYPNVWIDYTLRLADKLLSGGHLYNQKIGLQEDMYNSCTGVVISDCRFKNEMEAIKKKGGKLIRVTRDCTKPLADNASLHLSETEQQSIPNSYFDYIIENNHVGLDPLKKLLNKILMDMHK
jgi:hypothetical protein